MKEKLQSIKEDALAQIAQADDRNKLNEVRVSFLGKKGMLTAVLKSMKEVAPEERPAFGQLVNETRAQIESVAGRDKEERWKQAGAGAAAEGSEVIDVTLPAKKNNVGHRHPNTIALEEVERIFHRYGLRGGRRSGSRV